MAAFAPLAVKPSRSLHKKRQAASSPVKARQSKNDALPPNFTRETTPMESPRLLPELRRIRARITPETVRKIKSIVIPDLGSHLRDPEARDPQQLAGVLHAMPLDELLRR